VPVRDPDLVWPAALGLQLGGEDRRLLAVLCNPSLQDTESTTSWRNLTSLAAVVRAGSVTIANLIEVPTRSTQDLAGLGDPLDLPRVTRRLEVAARSADVVVLGWGTRAPRGWSARAWRDLVASAVRGLRDAGHEQGMHVGVGARHPSRWRQHTSLVHGRYVGETFELRLHDALRWTSLQDLSDLGG
jgi:Protein of unknown function (DUF1643)